MTNEITIFPSSNGQTPTMDEFLAPGNPGTYPPIQPLSPLHRLHRVLRGRYWLAGILCGAGALTGAILGYSSQSPQYKSDGLVEITPTVITPGAGSDQAMPFYQLYVNSQVQILQSPKLIQQALLSETWTKVGTASSANDPMVFGFILDVGYIRNSSLIRVSFTDPNPKVAQAAVAAVLEVYKNVYGDSDTEQRNAKLNYLNERLRTISNDINSKQKAIEALTQQYGTDDLTVLHETRLKESLQYESDYNTRKTALDAVIAGRKGNKGDAAANLKALIDQLTLIDPVMQRYVFIREEAAKTLREYVEVKRYLKQHPKVIEAEYQLEQATKVVEQYAKDYPNRNNGPRVTPETLALAAPEIISDNDIARVSTQVEQLNKQMTRAKTEVMEVGKLRQQIGEYKNKIATLSDQQRAAERSIGELNAQNVLSQRTTIASNGDLPKYPFIDKRKVVAVAGFTAGGLLPLVLIVGIGFMDRRYRFSDDAGADISGLPLLGVLPNLPDRLSDPEQAAVASHCVHQIRARLQISGTGQNRHVWAVTSAASGDGKTSLTLSLGLSFAACGARTLLIDCDLVGAGLSARLNIKSPQGILEAVASRTLLQYVHSTDAADVAILPAGAASPQQGSALSPVALRRLISEAKKHFEVILIDTGPILGSLEASLVATVVDGVVLTVARGQQRPLVERSIAHLNSIGARIAGIVFNRASDKDFITQMSTPSQRTQIRANGRTDTAPFGPVARAVASSSFKGNSQNNG